MDTSPDDDGDEARRKELRAKAAKIHVRSHGAMTKLILLGLVLLAVVAYLAISRLFG